ncbi:hypothetical protein FB107DRAFT_280842, partial [Schizophyllum commune]
MSSPPQSRTPSPIPSQGATPSPSPEPAPRTRAQAAAAATKAAKAPKTAAPSKKAPPAPKKAPPAPTRELPDRAKRNPNYKYGPASAAAKGANPKAASKGTGAAKPGTQLSRKASSKARSKAPSRAESVSMDVDEPAEGTDVQDARPNSSPNEAAYGEHPMEVDGPENTLPSYASVLKGSAPASPVKGGSPSIVGPPRRPALPPSSARGPAAPVPGRRQVLAYVEVPSRAATNRTSNKSMPPSTGSNSEAGSDLPPPATPSSPSAEGEAIPV